MVAQLAKPEGTIVFRYTFPKPLDEPPATALALLETPPTSASLARLELDPRLTLSFLYSPPDQPPRIARVNLQPLQGTQTFQIYLVWSPTEVRMHVGSRERDELLNSAADVSPPQ
jgi:hypothetical protein